MGIASISCSALPRSEQEFHYSQHSANIKQSVKLEDTLADVLGIILTHMPLGVAGRLKHIEIKLEGVDKMICLIEGSDIPSRFLDDGDFHREVENFRDRWRRWLARKDVDLFVALSSRTVGGEHLQAKVARLEKEVETQRKQSTDWAEKWSEENRKNATLVAANETLKKQNEALSKTLGGTEAELKTDPAKVAETERVAALEAEVAARDETIAMLTARLNKATDDVNWSSTMLFKLQTENAGLAVSNRARQAKYETQAATGNAATEKTALEALVAQVRALSAEDKRQILPALLD